MALTMRQSTYSIYETKAHLSRILKQVKAKGEVIITDRGTPSYKIVAYKKEETFKERYARLIAEGSILERNKLFSLKNIKTVSRPGALKRFLEERD